MASDGTEDPGWSWLVQILITSLSTLWQPRVVRNPCFSVQTAGYCWYWRLFDNLPSKAESTSGLGYVSTAEACRRYQGMAMFLFISLVLSGEMGLRWIMETMIGYSIRTNTAMPSKFPTKHQGIIHVFPAAPFEQRPFSHKRSLRLRSQGAHPGESCLNRKPIRTPV